MTEETAGTEKPQLKGSTKYRETIKELQRLVQTGKLEHLRPRTWHMIANLDDCVGDEPMEYAEFMAFLQKKISEHAAIPGESGMQFCTNEYGEYSDFHRWIELGVSIPDPDFHTFVRHLYSEIKAKRQTLEGLKALCEAPPSHEQA